MIDIARHTIYVMAHTLVNNQDYYTLHALDLSTLKDKVPPAVAAATTTLSDGTSFSFAPRAQRQRPGLLEANNAIYAAFGSRGDTLTNISRGWMLGWNADTLAPLANSEATNRRSTSFGDCWLHGTGPCFLSSIWMSGFAPAADASGNLFFLTANSDPGTYDGVTNIQESAVKLTGDLSTVLDLFTPHQQQTWDSDDNDFGSGGIVLLPDQAGPHPHVAVAAGKSGTLYILDRDNMGGFNATTDQVIAKRYIDPCWCGPSYFVGSDGVPRIVASGGSTLQVFKLNLTKSSPFTLVKPTATLNTGQDPGFFTSVSSNGTTAGTAIIWALTRPVDLDDPVMLYAFDATTMAQLYQGSVGVWPTPDFNANVVPVVANGKVYVSSGKQITVLGLGATEQSATSSVVERQNSSEVDISAGGHKIYGNVKEIAGNTVYVKRRDNSVLVIDDTAASAAYLVQMPITVGEAVEVEGEFTPANKFVATQITRVKSNPALWAPDR